MWDQAHSGYCRFSVMGLLRLSWLKVLRHKSSIPVVCRVFDHCTRSDCRLGDDARGTAGIDPQRTVGLRSQTPPGPILAELLPEHRMVGYRSGKMSCRTLCAGPASS